MPIAEGSLALREQFDRALNLLLWGLGALLAMVCESVAGILVARAVRRERETAVRMALGASHLRLAQRAFFESMALGVMGAGWGLTLAYLRDLWSGRCEKIDFSDFVTFRYEMYTWA